MLVLARQLNERIIMPTVPATIEVVAVKTNGVRLGIEAPPEITILREEVLRRGEMSANEILAASDSDTSSRLDQLQQLLRNRLTTVALGLDLLRQSGKEPNDVDRDVMLQRLSSEVRQLDAQIREFFADSTRSVPKKERVRRTVVAK